VQISDSVRKIRGYAKKVMGSTNRSLKRHKTLAATWNVQQMEVGRKPDGSMQPGYSAATEGYQRTTPISAGEPIKLKDTGAFHKGVKKGTTVHDNIMELKSSDEKNDMLDADYSPFGLTEFNLERLKVKVFDDLADDLRAYFK